VSPAERLLAAPRLGEPFQPRREGRAVTLEDLERSDHLRRRWLLVRAKPDAAPHLAMERRERLATERGVGLEDAEQGDAAPTRREHDVADLPCGPVEVARHGVAA
jgi:hypothetical protein